MQATATGAVGLSAYKPKDVRHGAGHGAQAALDWRNAMKTNRMVLLCVAGVLLAGCSTMDERGSFVPPQRAPSIMDSDAQYMAYVERIARRRGIHVTWVNAPRRRMPDTANSQ